MSKKILECSYCKSIIKETDTTCPKCGANCSDVIKKYHEEKDKETKAIADDIGKAFTKPILIMVIFTIIAIIMVMAFIFFFSFNTRDRSQIKGFVDNSIETEKYDIKIEEFEEFEYYDDFFSSRCNTKEGYKKIAFKIVFENKSGINIRTNNFLNSLTVKAEDEVLSTVKLIEDTNFCQVIKGTNNYNGFPSTDVLPNDKVSGYVGYEIPKNKKKIKFIFNKNQFVEIDNPAYQE